MQWTLTAIALHFTNDFASRERYLIWHCCRASCTNNLTPKRRVRHE